MLALLRPKVALTDWHETEIAKARALVREVDALVIDREWVIKGVQREKLLDRRDQIARYQKVLQAGYEPTTLPAWEVGIIERHRSFMRDQFGNKGAIIETWQPPREPVPTPPTPKTLDQLAYQMNQLYASGPSRGRVKLFTAPIPRSAWSAYRKARPVFGVTELRVLSPNEADFAELPRPVAKDPVIIGRVLNIEGAWRHFEVARWNVTEDLAALYASLH